MVNIQLQNFGFGIKLRIAAGIGGFPNKLTYFRQFTMAKPTQIVPLLVAVHYTN